LSASDPSGLDQFNDFLNNCTTITTGTDSGAGINKYVVNKLTGTKYGFGLGTAVADKQAYNETVKVFGKYADAVLNNRPPPRNLQDAINICISSEIAALKKQSLFFTEPRDFCRWNPRDQDAWSQRQLAILAAQNVAEALGKNLGLKSPLLNSILNLMFRDPSSIPKSLQPGVGAPPPGPGIRGR
jgi:hypothetical protein